PRAVDRIAGQVADEGIVISQGKHAGMLGHGMCMATAWGLHGQKGSRGGAPHPRSTTRPHFLGPSAAAAVISADTPTAPTGPDERPDVPSFSPPGLPEPLPLPAA